MLFRDNITYSYGWVKKKLTLETEKRVDKEDHELNAT